MSPSARAAQVAQIASWYRAVDAQSATEFPYGTSCEGKATGTGPLSSLLAARGMQVSNYRNGSFVSQSSAGQLDFGEAAILEQGDPLSIMTFWPGDAVVGAKPDDSSPVARLTSAISATATSVSLSATGSSVPYGSSNLWPYLDSRGTGLTAQAHSQDTHNFVAWVRVDNELMQVVGQPVLSGGNITLQVVRGLWGTAPSTHASSARVMSPVYSGSTSVIPTDADLNGAPSRNDATFPLRYVVKIWQSSGQNWIIGRIKTTFSGQGYNAVWSDTTGCDQYSFAAGNGAPVAGWDDPANTALTNATWGADQLMKLTAFRAALPGYQFDANSVLAEGNNLSCDESLLANYDSGSLEHWMDIGNASFSFANEMQESFDIQSHNWPGAYWPRWDLDSSPTAVAQYKRFAYGALLLSRSAKASRTTFGDTFGLTTAPDQLFLWTWGTPSAAQSLASLAIASTPLYGRQFANGEILVNPSASAYSYQLPTAGYDVVHQTGGNPTQVTSVTVGAHDAAFILQP